MDKDSERPADHPEPGAEPVSDSEAPASPPEMPDATEPAASTAPSHARWDAPTRRGPVRRLFDGLASRDGSLQSALRVGALVVLAAGALYAALLAIPQDAETAAVAVRAPTVIPSRAVPVDAPRPPAAPILTYEASKSLRDLDLRGSASGFVRLVPEAPAALCDRLKAAGWETEGWTRSPLGGVQECIADRRYGAEGQVGGFAVLRGDAVMSELRIKLNVADPAARMDAARDVGTFIAAAFGRWRWDGGEDLGAHIAALEPFETVLLGTRVRLMREHGDVERWNLVLRFPTPPPPPDAEEKAEASRTVEALRSLAEIGGSEDGGKSGAPEAATR